MDDALDVTRKARVLVVDDTPANLSAISELLKGQYQVLVANNGAKGLELAKGPNPPDLILLDVMMPELSGYEVCQELKRDPERREIPIIFFSSLDSVEDERKGLELGAVDYIAKPVNAAILRARIRTHLRIKAMLDFLRDKSALLEREVELLRRAGRGAEGTQALLSFADEFLALRSRILEVD